MTPAGDSGDRAVAGSGAPALHAVLLRFAAGLYGLAVAIALYPAWLRPAPPWQAPGVATSLHLDAHGPFLFVASLLLLPILVPFLLRPAVDRLSGGEARRWAQNGALVSLVAGLWAAIGRMPVPWVLGPSLAGLLACTLLRRLPARFSRRDWILAPAILTVWIALLDRQVGFDRAFLLAALAIFALRLLAALPDGRPGGNRWPQACFALAPLGLVCQSQFVSAALRYNPWPPLVLALLTPVALHWLLPARGAYRRPLRRLLAFGILPLAALSYHTTYNLMSVEGRPRISLFEEAEHVASAHEMMHGEKPYRDIVPIHGFLQDSFLDYVLLRGGASSLGTVMSVRQAIEALGAVVQYALAAAATGSPEAGLAAALLGNLLGLGGTPIRVLPSLVALTFLVWGLRRRRPGGFAAAAGFAVVAGLTSLDYGTYALGTLGVALLRLPRPRRAACLRAAVLGAAGVAVPVALAFAVYGIALDFLQVTLREIPSWTPAYTDVPFKAPAIFSTWRFFPEVLVGLFDRTSFLYLFWAALIAALGAVFLRPAVRRWEMAVTIGVWCALNALGYAGRHHTTFHFATAVLLAVVAWRAARSRVALARAAVPVLVVILFMVAQPTGHLIVMALQRDAGRSNGGRRVPAGWTEMPDVPRARGALWETQDAVRVRTVRRYVDAHLAPGETYFDFTNGGLIYYLLDRECPLRWIEVAFYESQEAQLQVVDRLIANPKIRFAVLAPPEDVCNGVDCIPNRVRAPRVWEHIERSFVLDQRAEGLEFWRRR